MNDDAKNAGQDGLDQADKSEATDIIEVDGKKYTKQQAAETIKKLSSTVGKQGNELGHRRKFMNTAQEKIPELSDVIKTYEEDPKEALKQLHNAVVTQGKVSKQDAERIQNNEEIFNEFFTKNPSLVKVHGKDRIRYLSDTMYKDALNKSDDALETLGKLFGLPTQESEEEETTGSTTLNSGGKRSVSSVGKSQKQDETQGEKFDPIEILRNNSIYRTKK